MPSENPPPLLPPPMRLLRNTSLFLDFDGTLVRFADRPDAVAVDSALRGLIGALAERLEGRLAIVSGRSADEITAFFPAADPGLPAVAVAGSHGVERRWPDGRSLAPAEPDALAGALDELRALAGRHPGVVVEEKPFGVALHYRQAPQAADLCNELADSLAARAGFVLQRGSMVCELRAKGADKGDAVRAFMAEPPMAGHPPLFIGDDLTDEHGFEAAAELSGAGILVGAPRATAARYRLPDVAAVHRWLGAGTARRAA